MTHALHPIRGKNSFCGPAAMASVLGINTDHASRVLRSLSGDKRITGVYTHHLIQALNKLGCEIEAHSVPTAERVLVRQWAQANCTLLEQHPVIIVFSSHFGTLFGDTYQCNITRNPIDWTTESIPHEGGEVIEFLVLKRLPSGPVPDEMATQKLLLQRAQRLAAKHGVHIALQWEDEYLVTCPELEHDDPHEGAQVASTVHEVMSMVEDYVYCLKNGYQDAVTDECMWDFPARLQDHSASMSNPLHCG